MLAHTITRLHGTDCVLIIYAVYSTRMWTRLLWKVVGPKPDQPDHLLRPCNTYATRKLLQEDESNEEDPFASLDKEDGGLEQNKLVIDIDSD